MFRLAAPEALYHHFMRIESTAFFKKRLKYFSSLFFVNSCEYRGEFFL